MSRALARAEIKRLHLEVAADNNAAGALYTKAGFMPVGRRAGYYQRKGAQPVDAITLARDL
jgi:[ribosomal protein S18]-alanine N-acetyltransferase